MKSEFLLNKRKEKNLTQADVAKRSNIKRPYYSMIENGLRTPSVNVAKRIATVLGFKWTIFFDLGCNELTHKDRHAELNKGISSA